jgi:hypothetical protein
MEIDDKNQVNIENHDEKQFFDIVQRGLIEGGINLNAMKNWGKSRLLFAMCQTLRTTKFDKPIKCICFDGSEAWLYGFSKIPTFNINENDISMMNENKDIQEVEQYSFNNWQLVKLALEAQNDLLIRFRTKRPSKRGFCIRTICNYLDDIQRTERETTANHEPKQRIVFFIDELQDAFSNRATMRTDAEIFLCCFNEARNNFESFFSANIRETDTAKTIRSKQLNIYGKIPECDKNAYQRRLEKQYSVNFSNLQQRTWFLEGETFTSPNWSQVGKPFIINRALRAKYFNSEPKKQPKHFGAIEFFKYIFNPFAKYPKGMKPTETANTTEEKDDESEYDGVMTLPEEDSLLPEEEF